MSKPEIIVQMNLDFVVHLPEGCDELTEEAKERAIEAVTCSLRERMEVYLDGKERAPAIVDLDISDDYVEEVRLEG